MNVPFVLCEALLWSPIVNSAEQWWAMTAPTQCQLHLASQHYQCGDICTYTGTSQKMQWCTVWCRHHVISNKLGRFSFSCWASVSNAGPEAFISETVEGLLKLEDGGINWVLVWLTLKWGVNLSMEVQYYCSALLLVLQKPHGLSTWNRVRDAKVIRDGRFG